MGCLQVDKLNWTGLGIRTQKYVSRIYDLRRIFGGWMRRVVWEFRIKGGVLQAVRKLLRVGRQDGMI